MCWRSTSPQEASMSSSVRSILALTAVAAGLVALPFAQVAHAGPDQPTVPPEIVVSSEHKLYLVAHAAGAEIYTCNGITWGPATPRADLFDDRHNLVATHFGGPSWQARDGSKVVAQRDSGITV